MLKLFTDSAHIQTWTALVYAYKGIRLREDSFRIQNTSRLVVKDSDYFKRALGSNPKHIPDYSVGWFLTFLASLWKCLITSLHKDSTSISVANINKSDKEPCCNCTYDGVYLVNGPEYYDKQGNSNGKNYVDGQDQRVECGIRLQAGTQDRRESGQSKSPCTRTPMASSKSHNYRHGWQDKSRSHHCNVDMLYAVCSLKWSSMKGESYPPK